MIKHQNFSFYSPAAYAIALVVADIPQCFVQVSIWQIVIYFMADLQRTASQFFISWLFVFFNTLAMYSMFRAIGAFSANLDGATRVTGITLQALIVYAGYLIPQRSMKPWLGWIRWINPMQYAFEGVMSNEFHNLRIDCSDSLVPNGPQALQGHQGCNIQGSAPGATLVDGDGYLHSQLGYFRSHLWRDFGIIIAFWVGFAILTAIGLSRVRYRNRGTASMTVFKDKEAAANAANFSNTTKLAEDQEMGITTNTYQGNRDILREPEKRENVKMATQSAVFTWQDVGYEITVKEEKGKKERHLIKNVHGYATPGRLTALCGESGAGKTTLLNLLAQRTNSGTIEGKFFFNGTPLPPSFGRLLGYAEQQDIHEPTATVRESLRFSALLRRSKNISIAEKFNYVETVIELLQMGDIADAIVGTPGAGLNLEQRKRLTIGVELASKPDVLLFLDEVCLFSLLTDLG
jgi:ABC-type multidrug transport system permease subunit/ABC-type nitrate/sulfonate/bicarbonate transport system ATPase subunit